MRPLTFELLQPNPMYVMSRNENSLLEGLTPLLNEVSPRVFVWPVCHQLAHQFDVSPCYLGNRTPSYSGYLHCQWFNPLPTNDAQMRHGLSISQ